MYWEQIRYSLADCYGEEEVLGRMLGDINRSGSERARHDAHLEPGSGIVIEITRVGNHQQRTV